MKSVYGENERNQTENWILENKWYQVVLKEKSHKGTRENFESHDRDRVTRNRLLCRAMQICSGLYCIFFTFNTFCHTAKHLALPSSSCNTWHHCCVNSLPPSCNTWHWLDPVRVLRSRSIDDTYRCSSAASVGTYLVSSSIVNKAFIGCKQEHGIQSRIGTDGGGWV